jgi:ribosomal-protein-alanine N-acetyltransferase
MHLTVTSCCSEEAHARLVDFSNSLQDALNPLIVDESYGSTERLMIVIVAVNATREENLAFCKGYNKAGTYTALITKEKVKYCSLAVPFGSDDVVNTPEGMLRRQLIDEIIRVMAHPVTKIPKAFEFARLAERLRLPLELYAQATYGHHNLTTERLRLRPPVIDDQKRVLAYRLANREHLQPWEPERDASYYTLETVEAQLTQIELDMEAKSALHWLIQPQDSEEVLGMCSFTNIVRGAFQACHLGFSLAGAQQGKGYMQEALTAALAHVFEVQKLHRVMANHQPDNLASEKLLQRLGFEREGYARQYLHINGAWRDHVLTSLISPGAGTYAPHHKT